MMVSWGPRKLVWKLVVSCCGLEMRRRGDLIQRWLVPVESVSWVIETGLSASSCRPMIHSWNHYLHLPHNSVGVMILDHFEDAGFPWLPFSANDLTKNGFCPVAKNRFVQSTLSRLGASKHSCSEVQPRLDTGVEIKWPHMLGVTNNGRQNICAYHIFRPPGWNSQSYESDGA